MEKDEATKSKCKDAKQERDQLKELDELKKELEEVWAGFVAEEALTEDYQKQVDKMFFYGYQCCMRKNRITQDILSYPSDKEKDATISGPAQKNKDPGVVNPSNE